MLSCAAHYFIIYTIVCSYSTMCVHFYSMFFIYICHIFHVTVKYAINLVSPYKTPLLNHNLLKQPSIWIHLVFKNHICVYTIK